MNCPKCHKEVSPEWNVCPHCGYKPIKCSNPKCNSGWLPNGAKFCPVCGTVIKVETTLQAATIPSVSSQVNYFTGLNSISGTLTLDMVKAVFKAQGLNIGDASDKTIPIANICGYKKGILAILHIYLNNGYEIKLATRKKDALIASFEERRHAIFTNQGKPIPPLTKF